MDDHNTDLLIAGRPTAGEGESLVVENPYTEETIATVGTASPEQADAAIDAPRAAWKGWAAMPAGERCELVFATSDNPRGEDPLAILSEVWAGLAETPAEVVVEPDRRRAIERALSAARPGDVVLIAGKGHESAQVVGGESLPFDDRAVARELLGRSSGSVATGTGA